jgi:hypothetical protein
MCQSLRFVCRWAIIFSIAGSFFRLLLRCQTTPPPRSRPPESTLGKYFVFLRAVQNCLRVAEPYWRTTCTLAKDGKESAVLFLED